MARLPTGTVTFLLTDARGIHQLRELGVHWDAILLGLRYLHEVLRTTIEAHGGSVFKEENDELCTAFASAATALNAALAAQRSMRSIEPDTAPAGMALSLKVAMALHTGTAAPIEGQYTSAALQRALRLRAVVHGGQILLSRATQELVQDDLPSGVSLKDLGLHHLPDLDRPEQLFQLLHPDLPADFPPLHAVPVIPADLPRGELLRLLFELHQRLDAQKQRSAFLSIDVVDSSEMKRGGTPMVVEYTFDQFQRWIEEVVHRRGGTIQAAAGDGVMCLFRSDAQALQAARELLEGIDRINTEQNRLPLPFRMRCGVSAGEIAVDAGEPIGRLQSAVIDRAAALQKRAQPGSILVSSESAAAALIELGPVTPFGEPTDCETAFEWRPR